MKQSNGSKAVEVIEVGPPDSLQNEFLLVFTADKIVLAERSRDIGAHRTEVASFVNPRRVRQIANAQSDVGGARDFSAVIAAGVQTR